MPYPYRDEAVHDVGPITGVARDSSNIHEAQNILKRDLSDVVFTLKPHKTPFTTYLTSVPDYNGMKLMKKVTNARTFETLEDWYAGYYARLSAVYAATGALGTVAVIGAGTQSGYIFTPGDVVRNARTGENMIVNTVSATSFSVLATERAFGSTPAAAGAVGDGIYKVGNVSEEGSGARNINTTRLSTVSNYTEIFKASIGTTGSAAAEAVYGGDVMAREKNKYIEEHALAIERQFMFGEKHRITGAGGEDKRTTGGIYEGIVTSGAYVQDMDGNGLTAPDMNYFLSEGFTYGDSPEKTLLCGPRILDAVNEIARGQLTTKMDETTYGITITKWRTSSGTVNLIKHPLLINEMAGWGILIDMDCFVYRYLTGRDTFFMPNSQASDIDGKCDQILSEVGLERRNMPKCALLKNVL